MLLLMAATKNNFLWLNAFFQAFHFSWMKKCFSRTEIVSGNFTLLLIKRWSYRDTCFQVIENWNRIFLFFQPSCGLCTTSTTQSPQSLTKFPGTWFFPHSFQDSPYFSAGIPALLWAAGEPFLPAARLVCRACPHSRPGASRLLSTQVTSINLSSELQFKWTE